MSKRSKRKAQAAQSTRTIQIIGGGVLLVVVAALIGESPHY